MSSSPRYCKYLSFSFISYYTNYLQGNLRDDNGKQPNEDDDEDDGYAQGLETRRAPGICKFIPFSFFFTILTIYKVIYTTTTETAE